MTTSAIAHPLWLHAVCCVVPAGTAIGLNLLFGWSVLPCILLTSLDALLLLLLVPRWAAVLTHAHHTRGIPLSLAVLHSTDQLCLLGPHGFSLPAPLPSTPQTTTRPHTHVAALSPPPSSQAWCAHQ